VRIKEDDSILAQFSLVGRKPYEIAVDKNGVAIKYFNGNWRYSAIAIWGEEKSPNGDPMKVLKITYGTFGWRILCQRKLGLDSNRVEP
jgi:hypothetical protein